MKLTRTRKPAAALVAAYGLACACAAPAMAADTVDVGMSTGLTGSVASLGITGKQGVKLAIDKINANGGLLGKKIKLIVADGELKPATGVTNVRNFILKDNAKAIFGPLSSAVGAAEAQTAGQYRVPIFFFTSNDVDQTGKYFSKYSFQVVPTTYMEPHAIAAYVAKEAGKKGWKTYYTISPNYSFGHSTVKQFLAGMKEYGAEADVVGQQWPKLGASDYSQYISAITSKKPDFVFVGQYGGDLITFTKQAEGYDLFKNTQVYAAYWLSSLKALGKKAPAGAISVSRSAPFYLHPSEGMKDFTKQYHKKYDEWPTTWAVLGYSAVETWAQGVKKADSFDADKVSEALSGATIDSIRGQFKIRACDHVAEAPEYVGLLSKKFNAKYDIRTLTHVYKAPAKKIMMPCHEKKATQGS
jgi:branched-chain amino acid transport system substrate-binding protein